MNAVHGVPLLTPLPPAASSSPDTVQFESRGAVLIRADDAQVADVVEKVLLHHRTTVFAPGVEKVRFKTRVTTVGARVVALRGHLGAFRVEVDTARGRVKGDEYSPNHDGSYDLVLDLCRDRLCTAEVAPLGYFAPGADPQAIEAAVAVMLTLVGHFGKPRYFEYQPDLCAHGTSGVTGCIRCLEACAADAIVSMGSQIRVDPYLCQGCASCTLACPSGALSFKHPARRALQSQLELTLRDSGPAGLAVIVHAAALDPDAQAAKDSAGARSMLVSPLSAFGDELWLRAFALGASDLVLVDSGRDPERSRATMAAKVAEVRAMLPALGIAQERLVWLPQEALANWLASPARDPSTGAAAPRERSGAVSKPAGPAESPTIASRPNGKRIAWLDTLRMQAPTADAIGTAQMPTGSAFGAVLVDKVKCTLCFACAQLCPTGALAAERGATERLIFQEGACIQCDLCVKGCPERALSLHAQFAPATLVAQAPVVLHQDEQLLCTSCSAPFISRRLLESSLQRLEGHAMLTARSREALRTCPACRQREMLNL